MDGDCRVTAVGPVDRGRPGTDVLGRAQAGDERAFLALYRAAQPGLLRYLAVIAGDAAEELAVTTWLEVARDLADFAGDLEGFRTWVAGVGRRLALDHLDAVRSGVVVVPPAGPSARQTSDRTARALRMIGRLPAHQAEAVTLRAVVGLDAASAAHVLGVRQGVLRRATRRGLQALSLRLEASAAVRPPPEVDLRDPLQPPIRTLRVVAESVGRPAAGGSTLPSWASGSRGMSSPLDLGARGISRDLTPSLGIEVSR